MYGKTCEKQPLSKRPKIGFQDQLSLNGSILQNFRPSLSYHLQFRPLFCLFLSGCLTQVLLHFTCENMKNNWISIFQTYLKEYKRYAPDMIFLQLRPEVKVTVTRKQYMTLNDPKMHPQTKFGIPTSNKIEDMVWTQFF